MDKASEKVRDQYLKHPYPRPIDDLGAHVATGAREALDPSILSPLLWPEGRPSRQLKILVAGCGTNQAALVAFTNRDAEVVGIDLSAISLGHESALKEKNRLDNLTLRELNLLEAPTLREKFDLIICTGVLHHMQDPLEGLKALASCLTDYGVLGGMLYGQAGRLGVYMLQSVLRTLGAHQDVEGIALARELVANLPAHHVARWHLQTSRDLQYDAGVVDVLLHAQDQPFLVSGVLKLINDAGLRFQAWNEPFRYGLEAIEGFVQRESELYKRISKLSRTQQWSVVELIAQNISQHNFIATTTKRPPARFAIDFSGQAWLNYRPVRLPTHKAEQGAAGEIKIISPSFSISTGGIGAAMYALADGSRTIAQILRDPRFASVPEADRINGGRTYFAKMSRMGVMAFAR
jgi:SAM-dependent methyltransferase